MSNDHRETLTFIAGELDDMMGVYHPGRPAYYALGRALCAVRQAVREVDTAGVAWPQTRTLSVLGVVGDGGQVSYSAAAPEAS